MKQVFLCIAILIVLTPVTLSDTSLNTSYNLSKGEHNYSHINLKLINKVIFDKESNILSLFQYDYARTDQETLKNNLKIELKYDKQFNNYKKIFWSIDNSYYDYIGYNQYRTGFGLVYKFNDLMLIGFIPSYDFKDDEIVIKVYENFKVIIFNDYELYHKAEIVKGDMSEIVTVDNGINIFVSDSLSVGLNANYEYNDLVQDDELSILITTNLKL